MKKIVLKSLCVAFVSMIAFSTQIFAQDVSYKSCTLKRGPEKNTVYVNNANGYPVELKYEVKIGSPDSPWRSEGPIRVEPSEGDFKLLNTFYDNVKAIRITYVDIKDNKAVKIMEGIGTAIGVGGALLNSAKK